MSNKKDWKILKYHKGNEFTNWLRGGPHTKIRSFQRVSDGEIFSLGDKCVHGKFEFVIGEINEVKLADRIELQLIDVPVYGYFPPYCWLNPDMYYPPRSVQKQSTP